MAQLLATSDPQQAAKFWVYQLGFYAGDVLRLRGNFTVTYGSRLDMPIFPDDPLPNPTVQSLYGIRTDIVRSQTWSPRVGFNWDLSNGWTEQQIRLCSGSSAGHSIRLVIESELSNTGNEFTRMETGLQCEHQERVRRRYHAAAHQRRTRQRPMRSTPWTRTITSPACFAATSGTIAICRPHWQCRTPVFEDAQDIDYRNLNLAVPGQRPDGRPLYTRANPAFSDVIFPSTRMRVIPGRSRPSSKKPFRIQYGTRRAHTSTGLGNSQRRRFEPGEIELDQQLLRGLSSTTCHWQRRTSPRAIESRCRQSTPSPCARPEASFSLLLQRPDRAAIRVRYNNDVNGDGGTTNDLFYIPRDASDVIISNGTFDQLMAFINDGCDGMTPGTIVVRNSCRAPWTNSLDFGTAFQYAMGRYRGEITFNVRTS